MANRRYKVSLGNLVGSVVFNADERPALKIEPLDGGTNDFANLGLFADASGNYYPGSGTGAPSNAQYIVAASNGTLTAERVATDTATVTWDFATPGQANANVPTMVGDSGTGGVKGLVPAPAAGDANKVLKGNATWGTSGDASGPGSSTDEAFARYDGTTGKLLQNSVVKANDTGDVTGVKSIDVTLSGNFGTTLHAVGTISSDGAINATGSMSASNLSGTNTGDNAANSSTHYIGTTAIALNRASSTQSLTGINSIDGSAATLTTPRAINGTNFDGSAAITVAAAAGTLTGATLASGVTASSLTSFGNSPAFVTPALGTPASGVLTNCTGTAAGLTAGNATTAAACSGNSATVTTNANLTGDVTSVGNATTIGTAKVTLAMQANMATSSLVYRKTAGSGVPEINTLATLKTDLGLTGTNSGDQTITLTGGVTGSGTGSFAATVVTNANLTGPITSSGNATSIASQTGTGTKFVVDTSPTLVTPVLGVAACTSMDFGNGVVGDLFYGTYTPTITNTTNVASSASATAKYLRIGDEVHVIGRVTITPTAGASTATRYKISLPVSSNLGTSSDLMGMELGENTYNSGRIFGDSTNDVAQVDYNAPSTTADSRYFSFMYRII